MNILNTFNKIKNLLNLLKYYKYFKYLFYKTYIIFTININIHNLHQIINHSPNLIITLIKNNFNNLKIIHTNFSTITYSTLTNINLNYFFSFFRILLQ